MGNVTQGRVQRKFSEVDACHFTCIILEKSTLSIAVGLVESTCVLIHHLKRELRSSSFLLTAVESLGMGSVEFSTIWVNVISLPKRRCKVQILIICTQTCCRIDRITILTFLGMRKHHWSEMKLKQYSRWQKINNCLLK